MVFEILISFIVSVKVILPTLVHLNRSCNSYVSILRRVGNGQGNNVLNVEGKGEILGT